MPAAGAQIQPDVMVAGRDENMKTKEEVKRKGQEEEKQCSILRHFGIYNPADLSVGFYEGDAEEFSN